MTPATLVDTVVSLGAVLLVEDGRLILDAPEDDPQVDALLPLLRQYKAAIIAYLAASAALPQMVASAQPAGALADLLAELGIAEGDCASATGSPVSVPAWPLSDDPPPDLSGAPHHWPASLASLHARVAADVLQERHGITTAGLPGSKREGPDRGTYRCGDGRSRAELLAVASHVGASVAASIRRAYAA